MSEVYGRIYVVTNKVNGKQYVGQTTMTVEARWRAHPSGDCRALVGALKKYGVAGFNVATLEEATSREDLDAKERVWIARLNTLAPNGYNLREGGANGKPSLETRERQALAHQGVKPLDETRVKMRQAQAARRVREQIEGTGPVFSDEARERLREARTGSVHSKETRERMSRSHTKEKPPKIPKQRGAALQGRPRPAEVVKKIAAANKGKTRSPEARARMSAARKAYYARTREDSDGNPS